MTGAFPVPEAVGIVHKSTPPTPFTLRGKNALVVGLANDASIAYGTLRMLAAAGANVAVTYFGPAKVLNRFVLPAVEKVEKEYGTTVHIYHFNAAEDNAKELLRTVFYDLGAIDLVVHSIAFAPLDDLRADIIDVTAEGFGVMMDLSVHSFLRLAKAAEPYLAATRGTLVTMTYEGAHRVKAGYGPMGTAKAALEAAVKYLAADLGPRGIRVHAVSAGTIWTRAAGALEGFAALTAKTAAEAPLRRLVPVDEVGALVAFLATDAAAGMTGGVHYVDGGANIV